MFWTLWIWEIRYFFSQKVDERTIFTDYWIFPVLNFLVMKNTVFFSVKKLIKRWSLVGLFELSMIFQDFGNRVFCSVIGLCNWLDNDRNKISSKNFKLSSYERTWDVVRRFISQFGVIQDGWLPTIIIQFNLVIIKQGMLD